MQRKTVTIQLDVTGNVKITYYFDDKYLKYANIYLFIELIKILKVLSNGLLRFARLSNCDVIQQRYISLAYKFVAYLFSFFHSVVVFSKKSSLLKTLTKVTTAEKSLTSLSVTPICTRPQSTGNVLN